VRFYRILARIFPRAFREDFERELEATASDMLHAEGARGRGHRLRLWTGLVTDAIRSGLAQRRAERGGRRRFPGRSLARDCRQAIRATTARPGSAAIIVALLALTLGANAAVFGIVNATLLRPMPFANPDRLVLLWEIYEPMHLSTMPWSDPDYLDARRANAFSEAAIFRPRRPVLTGRGEPVSLRAALVEHTLFDLLGVTPARGRLFTETDSAAGRDDVVVLSHALWVERFGADAGIIGQPIQIDNLPRTVIGILGPDVSFPPPITFSGQMISPVSDIFLPYRIDRSAEARGSHGSFAVARLRSGATLDAARRELTGIAAELERQHPDTNARIRMTATPLHGQSVMTIRRALIVLLAAVGGVLLVACASIANLILARAFSRGHEMALRAALGASRASLVRQLLVESAVLGVVGTVLGLIAAPWISAGLLAVNPIELPDMFRSSLDWRVLGFTAATTIGAICAFGLLPALHGSRADLVTVLRGTRTTPSPSERRTRASLVVVQVALAVVLLVTSALTIRSLMRLWQTDPGFRPEGLVATSVSLPPARYADDDALRTVQERLLNRAVRIPGVGTASAVTHLPFVFDRNSSNYIVVGEPARKTTDHLIANFNRVSPGYVESMRIPVFEGRTFAGADSASAPLVVVISQSLARRHWPNGGAVGHQLLFDEGEGERPKTIIGVVGDVRADGFEGAVEPTIYRPFSQAAAPAYWVVMTTGRSAETLAPDVRAALRDIHPALPVGLTRGLTEIMAATVRRPQFTAVVMTAFGAVALVIAAIGLYGVLSFDVAQQRRELGVRVALGATASSIRALVLTRGFRLVGVGLAAGVALSILAGRSISGLLFQVPATDALAFVVAGATLVLTAGVAIWFPARRASRADPVETLRT
jgi:putative ABC transport system permease protein